MVRRLRLVILPLVVVCFLLVGCFTVLGQTTEPKLISMSGQGWSLTVDKQPLSVDVKSVASVAAAKDMQQAQELSLVLNSLDECKSGVVEFKVDTVGLSCYKQLPLTESEIKEGAVRPENVVNSYACFDGLGRKVLHIYASRLIDAKGNSVWVDQNLTKGVLTVYLNQTWLEGAVFPVILDPSFGYTTAGGTQDSSTRETKLAKYYMQSNGNVNSISFYGGTNTFGPFWAGIYSDNGTGYPYQAIVNSSFIEIQQTTYQWWNFTLGGEYLTAGYYWLAVKSDSYATRVYYDSGSTYFLNKGASTSGSVAGSLISPINGSVTLNNNAYSIFVNYTVYSAPTASPSATAVPTSGFGFDMNWLIFGFVVFGAVLCIIPARIFVVRVVVGMFGIVLAVTQLQNTGLWFYPWSLVLWLFMSVCVLYSIWARTD